VARGKQISYAGEAVAFCQELLRCPSPSGEEGAVAERVEREMLMLGYDEVMRDDLGSVLGIVRGELAGRTVLFDAHMDTVAVVAADSWRYDPYGGAENEGRLWGRGAADAKGPLAALVVGVGALARDTLAGSVRVVASVGAERVVGLALAAALARCPAERVVVCEPTGLALGWGQRGRARFRLVADGAPAASACPQLGVSAVDLLLEALSRLRSLSLPRDELLGAGSCVVTELISSPYPAAGVLPDRCQALLDRHLVRGETSESVCAQLRQALAGLRGVQLSLETAMLTTYTGRSLAFEDCSPAWVGQADAPMLRQAQRALLGRGLNAETCLLPYTSSGAASAVGLRLPTLIYGPGETEKAHGIDESLRVDELSAAVEGYRALAGGLL
jgi:putative selenium metabolism hydrolase